MIKHTANRRQRAAPSRCSASEGRLARSARTATGRRRSIRFWIGALTFGAGRACRLRIVGLVDRMIERTLKKAGKRFELLGALCCTPDRRAQGLCKLVTITKT